MASKYIYFVGKPYPYIEAMDIARSQEYKTGIFLDKNVALRNRDRYDSIVEIDFSSPQAMITGLKGKNIQVDGLVCTYENYIVAKSRLAQYFKLAAPSIESAKKSTDKGLMRQAFTRADPAITPRYALVRSQKELLEQAQRLTFPLVLKPTNLVKSLLVLRCNDETELIRNYIFIKDKIRALYSKQKIYEHQPRIIVEEYILGKTCSIAAFIDKNGTPHFCDGIVSLINAQDIGAEDNYIYGRLLPAQLDKRLEKRLFETADKGIQALAMTSTPAHVELVYNDHKVKLIEIGARIGGYRPRMYAMSYNLNLVGQEVKLALGQTPNLSGKFRAYSAVFELFPKAGGIFAGIGGTTDVSKFAYYKIKAKPGDLIGPAKNGHKAVAVVIVSSQDKREFSERCETVNGLEVKIN